LRSLLPQASDRVNLVEMYSRDLQLPAGRPFLRVNMITTLDGATSFAGRSGGLGGPGDKLVFAVLRSLADVVVVGAGTARIERYGPVKLPLEVQRMREGRGQNALPPIAVVTQSLDLDWGSGLFVSGGPRPIVIAPARSDALALTTAGKSADVITTGTRTVDLEAALMQLGDRGMRYVLCEGGPKLNAGLVAAQLVDEVCLTLSPRLAGGASDGLVGGWLAGAGPRIYGAGPLPVAGQVRLTKPSMRLLELSLVHVLEEDSFLFLRLRPNYSGGSAPGPEEPPSAPSAPAPGAAGAPPSI
jgi:riboflavin biosynthesis pyrimidine reductase